jgi:hypothetical protein
MYEYARGRLVLWTRHDSGIDVRRGLIALAEGRRDREPRSRSVRASRRCGPSSRTALRTSPGETGPGREYFAGGPICSIGQCRRRPVSALAGPLAHVEEYGGLR